MLEIYLNTNMLLLTTFSHCPCGHNQNFYFFVSDYDIEYETMNTKNPAGL